MYTFNQRTDKFQQSGSRAWRAGIYQQLSFLLVFLLLMLVCFAQTAHPADSQKAEMETKQENKPENKQENKQETGIEFGPEVTEADKALFGYINQARENPLAMAEAVGLNKKDVLADLPEMREILKNGLPPLSFNHRLYRTADAHTSDMMEKNYYDYVSPDGSTAADRIEAAGYPALAAGESLGVLFFNNFIPQDVGVFQLFANMYRDELRPDRSGPGTILNPDFEEAGASVYSGIFKFNGFSGNVYMATCDFGARVATHDLQLMQLVNQARKDPRAVANLYDKDLDKFLEACPGYEAAVFEGLPPLVANRSLYAAAKAHAADMLAHEYNDPVSPENQTPAMRAADAGYQGKWTAESRFVLPTFDEYTPPEDAVSRFFRYIFSRALWARANADRWIFTDTAEDFAANIQAGKSSGLGGIYGDYLNLSVVEYGMPPEDAIPAITGVVFRDQNENGLYDPGEGIPDAVVAFRQASEEKAAEKKQLTDSAGGFTLRGQPEKYKIVIKATGVEKPEGRKVELEKRSRWLPIRFPAEEPAENKD
jgi:uncharacterized protein YkwD